MIVVIWYSYSLGHLDLVETLVAQSDSSSLSPHPRRKKNVQKIEETQENSSKNPRGRHWQLVV